jgi:hypothetical protein
MEKATPHRLHYIRGSTMAIARRTPQAADRACPCVRVSVLHAWLASCCLCGAIGSAGAAEPKERESARPVASSSGQRNERALERPAQRAEPAPLAPPRIDPRSFEARDELRRQQQLQNEQGNRNADAFRRNGRLTADERRDLRRQINEAGQDIYPNTPRR